MSTLPGGYGCPGIAYYIEDSADLVTWRDILRKSPTDAAWQQLAGAQPLVVAFGTSGGRARFLLKSPESIGGGGIHGDVIKRDALLFLQRPVASAA